jgi:hypothetical protein
MMKVIIEMRTKLDKRDDFNFPIVNFPKKSFKTPKG